MEKQQFDQSSCRLTWKILSWKYFLLPYSWWEWVAQDSIKNLYTSPDENIPFKWNLGGGEKKRLWSSLGGHREHLPDLRKQLWENKNQAVQISCGVLMFIPTQWSTSVLCHGGRSCTEVWGLSGDSSRVWNEPRLLQMTFGNTAVPSAVSARGISVTGHFLTKQTATHSTEQRTAKHWTLHPSAARLASGGKVLRNYTDEHRVKI